MKRENSRIINGDLVDRISDLPDSILSLILSFLPTKNALATTILSKRWKFMWTKVINLDFSHEDFSKGETEKEDMMKFVQFVNHVLLHLDTLLLNKFSLFWTPLCSPSQVNSWINSAITRNLRELFLCLDNGYDQSFEFPSSVFSCETLQYMELNGGNISLDLDIFCGGGNLPRLESLKLVSVSFCQETFESLMLGCPMLKCLHIVMDIDTIKEGFDVDDDGELFLFVLSSPSLRRLELNVNGDYFDVYGDMPHCILHLEAPSLEYLKLVGFISRIVVRAERLSSLVEADLQMKMCLHEYFDNSVCNSLVVAVRTLDCAKTLSLSRFTLLALSHATISLSTKFKRLTKLEVGADCCRGSLQDFIQSSDNLEVLTIYQYRNCVNHDDHEPSTWITPVEVPRCLSNSLKVVVVEGYGGFYGEPDMIGYMLKHGSVLEVMKISCAGHRDEEKFELLQFICKLPRKSPACTVDFIRQRLVSKLPTRVVSDMESISEQFLEFS